VELCHRDTATEKTLVGAFKGSQESADLSPHSSVGINMNFTSSAAIGIACPLFLSVGYGGMCSNNLLLAIPFIGLTDGSCLCELMHMRFQSCLCCLVNDAQAHLSSLTTDSPHDRWMIIFIGAMSALSVSSSARRIGWVKMFLAFFPLNSGTFHPFPYACREKV
jgi:hypothetical protein